MFCIFMHRSFYAFFRHVGAWSMNGVTLVVLECIVGQRWLKINIE